MPRRARSPDRVFPLSQYAVALILSVDVARGRLAPSAEAAIKQIVVAIDTSVERGTGRCALQITYRTLDAPDAIGCRATGRTR